MGAGGGQGLQQLQHRQKALLFLCVSVVTDALWGQKKILTLVFQTLIYISLHLGTSFPCCVNTYVSYWAV